MMSDDFPGGPDDGFEGSHHHDDPHVPFPGWDDDVEAPEPDPLVDVAPADDDAEGLGADPEHDDDPFAPAGVHDPADADEPDDDEPDDTDDDEADAPADDTDARGDGDGAAAVEDDELSPDGDDDLDPAGAQLAEWPEAAFGAAALHGWLDAAGAGVDPTELLDLLAGADPDLGPAAMEVSAALEHLGVDAHVQHGDTADLEEFAAAGGTVLVGDDSGVLAAEVVGDSVVLTADAGARFEVDLDLFEELWADSGNEILVVEQGPSAPCALVAVALPDGLVPVSLGIR